MLIEKVDLDALTKVLTSVKGVTLTLRATDRLNGRVRVNFGESPAPMKEVAKATSFINALLELAGALKPSFGDLAD